MRHKNNRLKKKTNRTRQPAKQVQPVELEHLEGRQLLSADLAGVRLVYNAAGEVEIVQWTGAYDATVGNGNDVPTQYKLTADDMRRAGETDFSSIAPIGWDAFSLYANGRSSLTYTGTDPYSSQNGTSFRTDDGLALGWLGATDSAGAGEFSFLHELPTDASLADLTGGWNYSSLALPVNGAAIGTVIQGAYGTTTFDDASGAFSYNAFDLTSKTDGTGSVTDLAAIGLGGLGNGQYFALNKAKNASTSVDLAYGDGLTYMSVALKKSTGITSNDIAGEYRFGAIETGLAAARRGSSGPVALDNLYLKLNINNSLIAYDLADWDAGTQTVVYTGSWTPLPTGAIANLRFDQVAETHLIVFGEDSRSFIDQRVTHADGASYVMGSGQRVNDDDGDASAGGGGDNGGGGSGGSGGGDNGGGGSGGGDNGGGGSGGGDNYTDDFGAGDDGSGDTLADNNPDAPRTVLPGRSQSGRQAIWEFGRDLTWYFSKLGVRNQIFDITGELVTWQEGKTHLAAAAAPEGMLLFTRGDNGNYTMRNLSADIGDKADTPVSQVTKLVIKDGRMVLLSLNDQGDVIAYFQQSAGANSAYVFVNLSQVQFRDKNIDVPVLTGTLTADRTPWNTLMIAGLDAQGAVWSLWFNGNKPTEGWHATALTQITGSEPIVGDLSIYFTSWKGINISGLTATGQASVLWWVPRFGGNWEVSNLTTLFNGPNFKPGTVSVYTTPWNAMTIVGISENAEMVAYWWAPGMQSWQVTHFTDFLPTKHPRVVRGKIYAQVRDSNDIWLFGRDSNNDMVRVFWSHTRDAWTSVSLFDSAVQF